MSDSNNILSIHKAVVTNALKACGEHTFRGTTTDGYDVRRGFEVILMNGLTVSVSKGDKVKVDHGILVIKDVHGKSIRQIPIDCVAFVSYPSSGQSIW